MTKNPPGKNPPSRSRALGKVTLSDVAALAGVAPMTASRAINQPELVSALLREHVGGADIGMARERHLARPGKDSDPRRMSRILGRQHEGGFRPH